MSHHKPSIFSRNASILQGITSPNLGIFNYTTLFIYLCHSQCLLAFMIPLFLSYYHCFPPHSCAMMSLSFHLCHDVIHHYSYALSSHHYSYAEPSLSLSFARTRFKAQHYLSIGLHCHALPCVLYKLVRNCVLDQHCNIFWYSTITLTVCIFSYCGLC